MTHLSIKAALLIGASILAYPSFAQQHNHESKIASLSTSATNGSFATRLEAQKLPQSSVEASLNQLLNLPNEYSFVKIKDRIDLKGISHASYQQFYKGIKVDGGLVLMHIKNGIVTSINGTIATQKELNIQAKIDGTAATATALKQLNVVKQLASYNPELVIAPIYNGHIRTFKLAYKVRIDGQSPMKIVMANVYVDASSGEMLKKVSLIAHDDVTADASTMYNGVRQITVDSIGVNNYVLRDNARKIETYDVGGIVPDDAFGETPPFAGARPYTNNSTNWTDASFLSAISLNDASDDMISGLGISGMSGNFITALVSKNGIASVDELELVSPYDVKMDIVDESGLPAVSQNLYVNTQDGPYTGIFAKTNIHFMTGAVDVLDTTYFAIDNFTEGVHSWSDTKGNAGSYTIEKGKNPALDAHWGMEMTHDYYLETFNRSSYDGEGSVLRNFINGVYYMVGTQNNAAALPAPYNGMVYGLGDGVTMGPVVSLDVMGHEFTHMVTEHNGNGGLNYEGESGALNESFSDIFGTCIEFYAIPDSANFTIGEKVVLTVPFMMRSMANPKSVGNPDTYKGTFFKNTSPSAEDNGGVHTNSSVPNKWFYLLCQGGSGINDNSYSYSIAPIGMAKAQQIAYTTLTEYLSPTAQFIDAYEGSLQAAADLYGEGSIEVQTVELAWRAVGVPDNDLSVDNNSFVAKSVRVYPNPTTGLVNVESHLNTAVQAGVYSIVGSKMLDIEVKPGINQFDFSTLSKGIYLIKYSAGTHQFVQKVVVK